MTQVAIEQADLSQCVSQVEAGKEILLLRAGKPVARLIAIEHSQSDEKPRQAVESFRRALRNGLDQDGLRVRREELYDRG